MVYRCGNITVPDTYPSPAPAPMCGLRCAELYLVASKWQWLLDQGLWIFKVPALTLFSPPRVIKVDTPSYFKRNGKFHQFRLLAQTGHTHVYYSQPIIYKHFLHITAPAYPLHLIYSLPHTSSSNTRPIFSMSFETMDGVVL